MTGYISVEKRGNMWALVVKESQSPLAETLEVVGLFTDKYTADKNKWRLMRELGRAM